MTLWNSLRSSFVSALRHPWLWLLQFLGNVAIFLVFVFWLHIDVATRWQVFLNGLVGLIVIVAALLLHGGTLNYYSDLSQNKDKGAALFPAFKNALKHLPAFAIWVAILYFLLHFVARLDDYQYEFPGYLRSEFPAWLRRIFSENALDNIYTGFVACLRWIVVPGLLLPLASLCARSGFSGFLKFSLWRRPVQNLAYWIVLVVAALIGVYCTGRLMGWTLNPDRAAVTKEGIWLGFRLFIAYLLALLSWLWVCSMLARAQFRPEPPAESKKAAA